MASIFTNMRIIIVAGLVFSLGVGSMCACSADVINGQLPRHATHSVHDCACVLKTGRCCCGKVCQCGRQAPQKDQQPTAPNSSNDRNQPLVLATDFAASGQAAVVAFHAHFDLNPLSTSNLTLFAQGTRLNV